MKTRKLALIVIPFLVLVHFENRQYVICLRIEMNIWGSYYFVMSFFLIQQSSANLSRMGPDRCQIIECAGLLVGTCTDLHSHK